MKTIFPLEIADQNDTLAPPTQDAKINLEEKLELIKTVLQDDVKTKNDGKTISVFDSKEHFKAIYLTTGVAISTWHNIRDPKVGLHFSFIPKTLAQQLSLCRLLCGCWNPPPRSATSPTSP